MASLLFFESDEPESKARPDTDKEAGQQYEEIQRAQETKRKQGRGDEIERIDKSKQRAKGEIREAAEKALEELRKRKKP